MNDHVSGVAQSTGRLYEQLRMINRVVDRHYDRALKKFGITAAQYILLKGINDTPAHIKELARILNRIKCRINIIRFHEIPDSPYVSPDSQTTIRFRDALNEKGIIATIRASRGEDIGAACGLLSTKELLKSGNKTV